MSNLLKIIFTVSLLLNVVLGGFVVTQWGKMKVQQDPRSARITSLIEQVEDKATRKELQQQWEEIQKKREEFQDKAAQSKNRLSGADGEGFSRRKLDGSFREIRRHKEEMQGLVTDFMGDLTEALPPEKRQMIERRLQSSQPRPMRAKPME